MICTELLVFAMPSSQVVSITGSARRADAARGGPEHSRAEKAAVHFTYWCSQPTWGFQLYGSLQRSV